MPRLDVGHEYAAQFLKFDDEGKLRLDQITRAYGLMQQWILNQSRVAGQIGWLASRHLMLAGERQRAGTTIAYAVTLGLHKVDPRPAVTAAPNLMGRGQDDEAVELLEGVKRPGSTNPADLGLDQAMAAISVHRAERDTRAKPASTDPTSAKVRPAGRVRPNPYRPRRTAAPVIDT